MPEYVDASRSIIIFDISTHGVDDGVIVGVGVGVLVAVTETVGVGVGVGG